MTAIMVCECTFRWLALRCTDRWNIVSLKTFCKMNHTLTDRVVEKKTNHIYSGQELVSSAREKVTEDGVEMGIEHSWGADY